MASETDDASLSAKVYLGIILVMLFPVCLFTVMYYAEPGFPYRTYVTLFLGYYATFGILLVVPIDIAVVVYDRLSTEVGESPQYNADRRLLSDVYNTFFTMILILGSLVLVLEEYFNSDGYFTVGSRLASTFKRFAFDNVVSMVAGGIILAILISQHVVSSSGSALMLTAVIVTNTIYETMLMFLLGYALIEYPREIWNESDIDKHLLRVQQRASAEFKAIQEAQLEVSLCVSDVLKTAKMVTTHSDQAIQNAMAILVAECPSEFRSDRLGTVAANKKGAITVDTLAELRTRLNTLKAAYRAAQAKVEGTKILAYTLEDIVAAKNDPGANTIHWSLYDTDSTTAQYNWHIHYKPMWLKFQAICFFILSAFSFLGVVCSMHGVDNKASVYYLAVHDTDSGSRGGIAIFILITLGYTTYITTWALFQAKISASMELVPHRTTPLALSFNVRMVARLAAPLAFFYLGWLAENGIQNGDWTRNKAPGFYNSSIIYVNDSSTNFTLVAQNVTQYWRNSISMPSAFSNFYQLQSVGIIKQTFGTIFPIMLFCVLFLFLTNAFNRLLVLLKMDKYQFGAALVTEEQLREGRRQLQRTKKATERTFRRENLRSFITRVANNEEGGGGGTFFQRFFGGSSGREGASDRRSVDEPSEKMIVKEPGGLSAKVEKKPIKGAGGGWKPFYAEVRSPGYLHFYKDKKAASDALIKNRDPSRSSDPNCLVINLTRVHDFTIPDKKNKDNNCVELDLGLESVRLRFADHDEAVAWKHGLQAWKDWNNDFGKTYPFGLAAAESGGPGAANLPGGTRNPLANPVAAPAAASTPSPFGMAGSNKKGKGGRAPSPGADEGNDDFDFGGLDGKGSSSSSSYNPKAKPAKPATKPAAAASANKSSLSGFGGTAKKGFDDYGDDKPELLEGWVEKKGGGRVKVGESWQKRYLRIDERNSCLAYYKTSNPSDTPAGTIDLKVVKDITPYEKGGKEDYTRFNVDVDGDKLYKFKVNSEAEGQRWVHGLNEWRDHFLMNM